MTVISTPLSELQRRMAAELLKTGHSVEHVLKTLRLNGDWQGRLITELIKTGHYNSEDVRVLSTSGMAVHLGLNREQLEAVLDQIPHTIVEGRALIDRSDAELVEKAVLGKPKRTGGRAIALTRRVRTSPAASNKHQQRPRLFKSFNSIPVDGDPMAKRWEIDALAEVRALPPFKPGDPVLSLHETAEKYSHVSVHIANFWVRRGMLNSEHVIHTNGDNMTVGAVRADAVEIVVKHFPYALAEPIAREE